MKKRKTKPLESQIAGWQPTQAGAEYLKRLGLHMKSPGGALADPLRRARAAVLEQNAAVLFGALLKDDAFDRDAFEEVVDVAVSLAERMARKCDKFYS